MAGIISGCLRERFAISQAFAAGWECFRRAFTPSRTQDAAAALPPGLAPRNASPALSPATASTPRDALKFSQRSPSSPLNAGTIQGLTPGHPNLVWADLMARISHDLRTPLNAVIGFSDVMSAELLGPVGHPRYREYAGDIRDCGRQLLKAAEDTLAMTALLTAPHLRGPSQPIGLAVMTSEAWNFCDSMARVRNIALAMDCDENIEALGELRPLRQVMVNLFTEAIARTPDGGTIRMSAAGDSDTIRIELTIEETVAPHQAVSGSLNGSLAMSLARALLELQGAGLLEISGNGRDWRAVTVVDRANQSDFFPAAGTPAWQAAGVMC